MFNEKNKTLIIKNNFKFRFHKVLKQENDRWRCTKNSCQAFFKMGKVFDTKIY